MSNDEVIAWVKQCVDLFAMRKGAQPEQMIVNEHLHDALGRRSMWMDTPVHIGTYGRGYQMELWLRGEVTIQALVFIPQQE